MKYRGLIAGAATLLLCACANRQQTSGSGVEARREIENQDLTIKELTRQNEELAARLRRLEAELEALRTENLALKQGKAAVDQISDLAAWLKDLQDKLGKDIGVRPHPEGVAIEVAETVLFDVGKSALRADGKRVLKDLAAKLLEFPGQIRVEGHTDDQPVVVHKAEYPRGNLELSGERALVVAHFLVTEAELPAGKMSFAGYGEHRPLVANASTSERQRNRRVEIVLLKPEMGAGK